MTRQPPCRWVERDDTGRPRCAHGWAHKSGDKWICREKDAARVRRYRLTEQGRAARQRENASDHIRSAKQLYELSRVRVS